MPVKIPVVFAVDNDYMLPLGVAICSLVENASKETFYEIYLLQGTVLLHSIVDIIDKIKKQHSNFSFKVICVNEEVFKEAKNFAPYLSRTSFFRLIISDLLPKHDKVIYLDADLVVLRDLTQMYETELCTNYIAAVQDWDMQRETERNLKHMRELGFTTLSGYINSGVLVMNLNQIRKDFKVKEFIGGLKKNYSFGDQDILNDCCRGRIYYLPIACNLKARYYKSPKLLEYYNFEKEESVWNCNTPDIVHYVGENAKPWKNIRCKGSEIWWEYSKIFMTKDENDRLNLESKKWSENISWKRIEKWVSDKQNIIIFGYSDIGKNLLRILDKGILNTVKCFCDNDVSKWGDSFCGRKVISLESAIVMYPNASFIVVSQMYYKDIFLQLENSGVAKENITHYFDKGRVYYTSLQPNYYSEEIMEIYYKEFGINLSSADGLKKKMCKEYAIQEKYYLKEWYLL